LLGKKANLVAKATVNYGCKCFITLSTVFKHHF
jgi:hypothetical protein